MKINVSITKNYYKSMVVPVEIPEHIEEDMIVDYLEEKMSLTLTDELADASFNEAGPMEIEEWDFIPDELSKKDAIEKMAEYELETISQLGEDRLKEIIKDGMTGFNDLPMEALKHMYFDMFKVNLLIIY